MAKANEKVHEYRMSGAAWLLEIVKREGIEEAEKELTKRRACFVPLEIPTSKMREFEQKVKWNTIDTVVLLSCATLHDEFGFGHDRLCRFIERFMLKTSCLADEDIKWQDYIDALQEEVGITFTIRENGEK